MPDKTRKAEWSRDSISNTLIVAVGLSLVCSVLVASTAIILKPVQERNEEQYRQQIILDVAGLYTPGDDIASRFSAIETYMVELSTGRYTDEIGADGFAAQVVARDPVLGIEISPDVDIANIHRRARFSPVYVVREKGNINQIILPVYGFGLWSTMQGFLSLDADGSTVRGLRFYEHAETPGLGDQIDKPEWRAQWAGKQLYGAGDEPRIEVIRGFVSDGSPTEAYEVDGISGATLTGRGVTNLVRYWTGPHGFGPYLATVRSNTGDE